MLVRWTSQDTVLVALLLAILMTVHSSAKSKDRTDSQAVARHATKSPAALLDDIPGNSSSVPTPSPKHFAQAPSRKHRTKVHRNGDAMVALATAPTMVNGTSQTARTHHEPFRDGIYVEKNTKNRGSRKKWHAEIQVGCRELQARRYITDGFCTSTKAINEVVCTGYCLPEQNLPWYAEFVKTIARSKLKEWQCVEDKVEKRSISLLCQDASVRKYVIKVVRSCKCKKMKKRHNKTYVDLPGQKKTRRKEASTNVNTKRT
uniref:CTCK domain-containing protein n=1 Tax=Biomphalaria glabrata TaxID=6526 RepID=A0A2C9K7F5_BIOGL